MEAEVLDNVERYLQVEDLLGIDSSMQEAPGGSPPPIDSIEDAERAALALRARWNLGGGPIPDMTELLEERGIKVFKLGLPKSVDGLTCHVRRLEGEDVPVVVCSTAKSIERQRFTIAHELGPHGHGNPARGAGGESLPSFRGRFLGASGRAHAGSGPPTPQFRFR